MVMIIVVMTIMLMMVTRVIATVMIITIIAMLKLITRIATTKRVMGVWENGRLREFKIGRWRVSKVFLFFVDINTYSENAQRYGVFA